ncbi:hypothetical protein CALCODRAFT_493694 [Calocera cornea HHB12733]|uniref:Uncharacterized protein n=1 Tax=Calocera cornea HHB12733 TaxID=1353952 RepID=A0A165HIQ8_9BASI|nr:hypothetical protein CALCODRAFT_493694 [Calocera cornea HHB12733]
MPRFWRHPPPGSSDDLSVALARLPSLLRQRIRAADGANEALGVRPHAYLRSAEETISIAQRRPIFH